jgi:hypothetical protein
MRDATHDSIDFPILSAGHSVAFKGMKKGMGFDSVITIQNFPSAGGFFTQAYVIAFSHYSLLDMPRTSWACLKPSLNLRSNAFNAGLIVVRKLSVSGLKLVPLDLF